jgi:hypothetical protein
MMSLIAAISEIPPDQLMLLAGIAILIITVVRRLILRNKRRGTTRQPDQRESIPEQIHTHQSFDESAVKLHDLFRELNARIDNKTQVLNELILEADTKIAELKRLARQATATPLVSSSSSTPAVADPLVIDMDTPDEPAKSEFLSDRFAEVYRLADQGLSAGEIGERTQQSAGEIELILTLRRGRQRGKVPH